MPDDPQSSAQSPEAQERIAAMKAKIAALKAQQAGGAAPPAQSASAPEAPASGASGDSEKERKLAEMRAKIEAAKAGGAASSAAATASAPAVAAAPAPKAPPKSAPKAPAKPAPLTTATKSKNETEDGVWYFGRRNFLQSIGWMSFFGFLTIMILGTLRAMFPRVIYERPPIFKAGFPGDYVPGTVSEKYKDEERVWIIRQVDGSFIALLAICTHLGCTPRWLAAENKFKCPCHGSGFRGSPDWGINFEGPAPRPLERIAISLAPDGEILIDKSQRFLWEKGQWDNPAAMLNV